MRTLALLMLLSLAFAAPARAADIPGSWSDTCDASTLFVSGNLMSAKCTTPDGSILASAVDLSTCGPTPQIGAPEGRLVCEGESAAAAAPPVKIVVLNPAATAPATIASASEPANFAGSWLIVASDGAQWPMTIQQSGTELFGSYDGDGTQISFKGNVDGTRALATWTMLAADGTLSGGTAFELVLFGNGKSLGASFLDKPDDITGDDFLARRAGS